MAQTPEYLGLDQRLRAATASLEDERAKHALTQEHRDQMAAKLSETKEQRDSYKSQVDSLAGRAAELDAREAQIAAREQAMQEADAAKNASSFASGVHLVGTDIQPGRYRSEGEELCYWARLSGLGGSFSEIIANGTPDGPGVVDISPSDVGFESSNCGTWTKVG